MRADLVTPSATVAAYLVCVFAGPLVFGKGLPRGLMRPLFFLWNLGLSVFSAVGVYVCAGFIYAEFFRSAGDLPQDEAPAFFTHRLICSDEMIMTKPGGACYGLVGFMGFMFTLSKFVELGDTAFLILMGKKIEFLQWWHHASVLLYCWFAWGFETPSALTFGTMNYFVHTVMYFYFAFSQYTTLLRPLRPIITLLQLAQMVVGVTVMALSFFYTRNGDCSATYSDTYFVSCGVMYTSYLVLFLKLFLETYVFKTRKQKQKKE
eukprot:TRINITY_DN9275_c0_g2_i1.p1 TRINITY_DN9275_c0_g2~~TRINITY_DN9275_c0_g2_i1.p1  ORF type:complete len:302 (+),score=136.68 TRINITY_DN9275_c0_g2_i1:118-906(+)